ncbi:MFS transporter [Bradyrhizobium sp. STM 3557]|uniref:MFS transporter n=1 Tax=Bradyrhizobium sp. STM 3557 TaxID=578920 RepID=UPI00388E8D0C
MLRPEVNCASSCSPHQAKRRRAIIAATIGNLLEWYDFFAYGVLAIPMAKLFFPAQNEVTSLFLALATYGGGVAMRPFGAVVLGLYADRVGRKASLCLSMYLMGLGTALIAFAPTYESIGVAAPLLVLLARLLQGFSGAGELGSATALLVEIAPPNRRGLYASFNAASQQIGFVIAAFVVMTVNVAMTPAQIEAWGWRLPFSLGLAIVPTAIYIRSEVQESDLFLTKQRERKDRLAGAAIGTGRPLLLAIGILSLYVVAGNIIFVYMPTFAARKLGLPSSGALLATIVATCVMIVCTLVAAMISDRVGRKPLLLFASVTYALIIYPAYLVVTTWPSVQMLMLVQSALALLNAIYIGPLMSTIAELFATSLRATAVAVAYGLTVMVGALSPALATWLIDFTGDSRAPAFAIIATSLLTSLALVQFTDRYREPLP